MKHNGAVYFVGTPSKHDRPRVLDSNEGGVLKYTLFSKALKFATFILDEAHQLRTMNKMNLAATELRHRSAMTIALTATPVMTSPQVRISICYHITIRVTDMNAGSL